MNTKHNKQFSVIATDIIRAAVVNIIEYTKAIDSKIFSIDKLQQKIESDLISLSETIISKVCVLELHAVKANLSAATSKARFREFIDLLAKTENQEILKNKYPVMMQQLSIQIQQYQDKVKELFFRINNDIELLRYNFFKSTNNYELIDFNFAGDAHCNGRSVAILKFYFGRKKISIVYKPRSLAIDQAFYQFLMWLNQEHKDLQFKNMLTIDRGEYGWCEFIKYQSCTTASQINAFYQRLGGVLAVMQLLIGSDIHAENIIASTEFPMIIDLECLLKPVMIEKDSTEPNKFKRFFVTDTHFLPKTMIFDGMPIDVSAFMAPAAAKVFNTGWKFSGTDKMVLDRKLKKELAFYNRPKIKEINIDPLDYTDDFIKGYKKIYQIILENKNNLLKNNSILTIFKNISTRILIRDTSVYGKIIQESYHPELLNNPKKRDDFFKKLKPLNNFEDFFSAEIKDLRSANVPYFSVNSSNKDIIDSHGNKYSGKIAISGFERMLIQLDEVFSYADLIDQVNIIEASFCAAKLNTKSEIRSVENNNNLAIEKLIHYHLSELMQTMITNADRVYWPIIKKDEFNNFCNAITDVYLYNGISGIGMVFALAGKFLKQDEYLNIAKQCLNSLTATLANKKEDFFHSIGGFSGLGGIIYALKIFNDVFRDKNVKISLNNCIVHLQSLFSKNTEYDIIGGVAGLLAALVSSYDLFEPDIVENLIDQCLIQIFSGYPVPKKLPESAKNQAMQVALLGYAHGVTGISWALDRVLTLRNVFLKKDIMVNGVYQDKKELIKHWIAQALEYERIFFDKQHNNWPDLRNSKSSCKQNTSWCHGSLGIGLAKSTMTKMWHDEIFTNEIDIAKNNIIKNFDQKNFSLCHGLLGNLNLLDKNSVEYQKLTKKIIEQANNKNLTIDGIPIKFAPGLMTGRAGIVYQLLKIIEPNLSVNPLLLQ